VQTCSNCNKQSADEAQTCSRCGADLRRMSAVAVARTRMQANPRVSLIRVSVGDDCCPACAAEQGAHPKHDVPVLPVEGCSGRMVAAVSMSRC